MARQWVTCGTPTIPGILNPMTAACDRGFVPDTVHILSNPPVVEYVETASEQLTDVVAAYGGDAETEVHELTDETDFAAIVEYYRTQVEESAADDEVAIDVTPGRKFMSAIAFQAGIQFGADHVYYFHRKAGGYHGQFYPEIPRTATDLIDFTEVL